MIELRCKHIFHEECITKWVERTAKCPICKAPQTDRPVFEGEDDWLDLIEIINKINLL